VKDLSHKAAGVLGNHRPTLAAAAPLPEALVTLGGSLPGNPDGTGAGEGTAAVRTHGATGTATLPGNPARVLGRVRRGVEGSP
jgi:hypothetical protein